MDDNQGNPPHRGEIGVNKVASNAAWLMAGETLTRAFGLIIAIYLARLLGASDYGALGIAFAFISYFLFLIGPGVDYHGVRDVAKNPDNYLEILGHILGLRVWLLLISLITAGLIVLLIGIDSENLRAQLVGFYSLTLVAYAFNPAWSLRGMERMRPIAIGIIAQQCVMLIAVILFAREGSDHLWRVAAIHSGSEVLMICGYLIYIRKHFGSFHLHFSPAKLRPTLVESYKIGLGRIPRLFYLQGGVLLLGWLSTASAAGEFLASHKIVTSLYMLGSIFQMNAFPVTSRLIDINESQALTFHANIVRFILIVIIPVVVGGILFNELIVATVFGPEFANAAPVMSIALLSVPLVIINYSTHDVLVIKSQTRAFTTANFAAFISHLVIGYWLITSYGIMGAAIACVAGEAIGFLVSSYYMSRLNLARRSLLQSRILSILAGAAVMAVVIKLLQDYHFITQFLLGGASYLLAAFLLGAISRKETLSLRHWIHSKVRQITGQ